MNVSSAWVRRLRRARTAACAIVILLVGVLFGGHPSWLPGFVRSTFVSQPQNEKLVDTVMGLLSKDYYRPVNTGKLLNTGLEGAVAGLGDPYSHYYPPQLYQSFQSDMASEITGVGVQVELEPVDGGILIEEVIQDSPAAKAGLQHGEIITAVNGRSLAGLSVAQGAKLIKGRAGTAVRLTVLRGRRRVTVRLTRELVVVPVVSSQLVTVDGRRIGYLRFTQFAQNSAAELRKHVRQLLAAGAQGLVLDLRDNPGGLVTQAIATASIFIDHGTIVSTRGRAIPTTVYAALGDAIAPRIPLVVLVDRGTASSAEIVTAALQDHHRALVVGTHTYGKGVFQEILPLFNGGALDITVGEYFTPSGRNLGGGGVKRGAGVTPNISVYDNPTDPGSKALKVAEETVAKEVR